MQTFRLIQGGKVDKLIAFKNLPKSLLTGVRKRDLRGLPRHWDKTGDFHYILDFKDINQDIERWQEIASYVRRTIDPSIRLLDKLEDMAVPMAPDCHVGITLEPENIPVFELPVQLTETKEAPKLIVPGEAVESKPRKGRPKKEAIAA